MEASVFIPHHTILYPVGGFNACASITPKENVDFIPPLGPWPLKELAIPNVIAYVNVNISPLQVSKCII